MSKFVLLFTRDFEKAREEVEALGGRVTQKFTDHVFEATLPDAADPKTLKQSSKSAPADLDETSKLMAAAWAARNAKAKSALESTAAGDNIPWDTKGFQPPRNEYNEPALRPPGKKKVLESGLESTGTPTSLYMTGTIAVGLVVVSGTGAGLGFSGAEQTKVIAEVMEGLQFLAGAEPAANLNFVYSIQFVTVSAAATASCASYEACEKIWRDPALQSLGFPIGIAGCNAYANKLKQQTGSNWSYVAFFTKYPQFHFAYASGTRLCMQYSNDGWGPDKINQVFAHETCHIFGAADEYGSCGCGVSGQFSVPNSNCVNCTTTQIACLMNANTLSLCAWSRGQLGWSTWAQIPGALTNVSVASDGTVWGVNAGGNIYRYTGSAWQQIPGALTRVSTGSAANVWGVNAGGNIYKYTGSAWQQIPGALIDVDVAADGTVWGVNAGGNIYKYTGSGWQQIPGALKRISVGSASIVWGVNAAGNIYKYTGSGWQQIPGALTEIGAAADGTVWGVNAGGNIYRYTGSAWQQIPGALKQISVGSASLIWGVNAGGNIYRRLVGAT